MERKFSTIVAMDVVGFSKMMAENEEETLKLLTERREVIDNVINNYEGRIFNTAGASVVAEFPSPVKAAECAVQIQNKNQTLNQYSGEKKIMNFRVGINMGDVMVANDNLYGDTINIAARLEASAVPEGICISKNVYDLIEQKSQISVTFP